MAGVVSPTAAGGDESMVGQEFTAPSTADIVVRDSKGEIKLGLPDLSSEDEAEEELALDTRLENESTSIFHESPACESGGS